MISKRRWHERQCAKNDPKGQFAKYVFPGNILANCCSKQKFAKKLSVMTICEKLVGDNVQIFRRKSNWHNAIHENSLQQYSPIQQSIWGKNLVKLQHSQMILLRLNYSGWWPYLWNVTTSNEMFLTKGNILSLELLNTFSIFSLSKRRRTTHRKLSNF